jgi:hypothetical protein
MRALNTSFVTPFDREDFAVLAARLDDVVDHIEAAADLTVLYRISTLPPAVRQQAELLEEAAHVTADGMSRLGTRPRPWPAGCPKEHGHHRARTCHGRLSAGLRGANLGRPALRCRTGRRHVLGGWRIMQTLGRRIFPLRPVHGFVARTTASSVLYLTAFVIAAPISTTQVMTASVMGVGATLGSVRPGGRCTRDWDGLGAHVPAAETMLPSRILFQGSCRSARGRLLDESKPTRCIGQEVWLYIFSSQRTCFVGTFAEKCDQSEPAADGSKQRWNQVEEQRFIPWPDGIIG